MKTSAIKDRAELRKILLSFGFKKANRTGFTHDSGIYADIIDMTNYCCVWMIGGGTKSSSGFPGGWMHDQQSLIKELENIIKK